MKEKMMRSEAPNGTFLVNRTVNGIPVAGNEFLKNDPLKDSDALRILLTARQRANRANDPGFSGENQLYH